MKLSTFSILVAAAFALTACTWIKEHQTQLTAVGEVALEHIARDVVAIAGNALANQAASGFTADWRDSLEQGAYTLTPTIISSGNLQDYLDAWNPAAPAVNKAIADTVSKNLPGDQVVAALKDPAQAQALASQVGVAIGTALQVVAESSAK